MHRSCLAASLAAGLWLPAAAAAEAPAVVASIKPVHALAAAVLQGVGTPHLIVAGGASPHATSLQPSDAAALERADLVVWVGDGLETFLAPALDTLAGEATVIELAELPGLNRLPYREGGPWGAHEHEHEHEHGHESVDTHLWLDPENAKVMVAAIADALIVADPGNRGIYEANRRSMADRLDQLTAEIAAELEPVKDLPFVVFHDAFQYFGSRFGLNVVGSVTVSPESRPGARRLRQIQARIAELGARCVFAEPQFEPGLVAVAVEGTDARTGTLDPLGAGLPAGPELYFELLRRNVASLKACLGEAG